MAHAQQGIPGSVPESPDAALRRQLRVDSGATPPPQHQSRSASRTPPPSQPQSRAPSAATPSLPHSRENHRLLADRAPPPLPPPPLDLDGDLRDLARGDESGQLHTKLTTPSSKQDAKLDARTLRVIEDVQQANEVKQQELAQRYIANQSTTWRRARASTLTSTESHTLGQVRVHSVVSSWQFDAVIGACICFNAFTIGVESTYTSKGQAPPEWTEVVEYLFLGVYALELGMRVFVQHLAAFKSHWVKFDLFLVICGLVDVLIRLALSGKPPDVLANIMLVRMLRLARLARAARLLVQFKVLWLLVQGLMGSLLTIMWTFVIIFVLVYIFAILGMELLRPDESAGEEYQEAAARFNEGLGHSMLVLVQFLTLDSIGGIYVPICIAKPGMTVYFMTFILLVSVALMNLVTALMVDSAQSQSAQDKEAEKAWEAQNRKRATAKLKVMFTELDEDGSGCLELQEIQDAPPDLKEQLQYISKMDDVEELFNMLDYDGSGSIEVDEFCDGVLKVSQENKPMELLRLVRQCTAIQEHTKKTLRLLQQRFDVSDADLPTTPYPPAGGGFSGKEADVAAQSTDTQGYAVAATADAASGAAVQELGERVGHVEERLTGIESRLTGMELHLQRIADSVCRPVVRAPSAHASVSPSRRPSSHSGARPSVSWT